MKSINEEEVKQLKEHIEVLRYKREQDFNALLEAQSRYYGINEKYYEAVNKLYQLTGEES